MPDLAALPTPRTIEIAMPVDAAARYQAALEYAVTKLGRQKSQVAPEWKADKPWMPGHPSIVLHSDDETMFAAGGVLEDGSNLMGLCWPGGQRVYRLSPDTDWAMEERFEGDAPERAQEVWRIIVDCAVQGRRDAAEETGYGR